MAFGLLNKSTAHQMLYSNQDYAWFQIDVNNINRRIFNLLSACRLYLDHCDHHLSNIYNNNSDKIKTVLKQKNDEYDTRLSYRLMEALRNYVQHRGYPTHKVKYNANRVDKGDDWQILYSLTPYIKIDELEKDKKFKQNVLRNLLECHLE